MLENLFNSPFLISLSFTLLHFLWQGLLVAMVLKSALLIFNNNRPQLRYALSALAMLINLLLPIITFIILYRTELSSANTLANSLVLSDFIQEFKNPDALFSYQELTQSLPTLLPYLSILWLATITLLSGKLLIEIATVNKLPHQGAIAPSDKLQARFEALAKQLNLTITPRLLISLKVEVPMAIGWLKPVVLLPASMLSGLNNAQLEMLLLHELAHIRRHDYLVNFIQTLVEILLFFHPAVLWVSKQMRNEREYCSDDIAVQHCGDAIAYAHTLADTASLCTKAHNHTIPDMAMAASGGDLKLRVIRLVGHHCAPKNNISKWFASATIIFSVLMLSSKQLLTMPLLDIWHAETPWKNPSKNSSKNQYNSASYNENDLVNNTAQTAGNMLDNNLPNSSIAQQLLVTHKVLPQKNKHLAQDSSVEKSPNMNDNLLFSVTKQTPKNTTLALKKSSEILTNTKIAQIASNETSQFTAQLNNLSTNLSIQSNDDIETKVTESPLMADEAFKRTRSSNPYQQELAQLAAQEKHSVAATNSEFSTKQASLGQYSALLEKPSSAMSDNAYKNGASKNNQLKQNTTYQSSTTKAVVKKVIAFNSMKEKSITLTEPEWQNAEQLEAVHPVYPSIAKRKGIEMEVEVDFTIGVDGHIKNITFVHQNKINYFKSSIRSAIKQWRFLPAKVDNKPVESQMTKVFAFSLQS